MPATKSALGLQIIALVLICCSCNTASEHFYPDGKVQSLSHYLKNTLLDSTRYLENGETQYSYYLRADSSIISQLYSSPRVLIELDTFNKNGDGVIKKFFSNGQLKSIFYYLSDTIVYGKGWDETGKELAERRDYVVTNTSDSIRIGEFYDATIQLLGPPLIDSTETALAFGNLVNKKMSLKENRLDTIGFVTNNQFKVHVLSPRDTGVYNFISIIRVCARNGELIGSYPLDYNNKLVKVVFASGANLKQSNKSK